MWFTATLALGVFLLWICTSILLSASYVMCTRVIGLTPYLFELPFVVMRRLHVPDGFIALVSFLPNAALVIVYFAFRPQENLAFKHWDGWNYFRTTFFPISMVNYKKPASNVIVIYAVAPHGVFPVATIFQIILNPLFDYVTVAVTSLLFWIPIVREFASLAGCIPANSVDIVAHLDKGHSVLVTPEGMRAILHYNEPDGVSRVLKGISGESEPRKGFIRCAVGSCNHARIQIVPIYSHGERDLYTVFNGFGPLRWLQRRLLSTYRYPWPVLAFGWWGAFWPRPLPLAMHFGEPISLMCGDALRDVDDIHKEFCNKMEVLMKQAL